MDLVFKINKVQAPDLERNLFQIVQPHRVHGEDWDQSLDSGPLLIQSISVL